MAVTDAVLKKYLAQFTDEDIAGNPQIRALRNEHAEIQRQHAAEVSKAAPLHKLVMALPGQIIDAQQRLDALVGMSADIAADIVCGISPARVGQAHDAQIQDARDQLARLKLAKPVIENRVAHAQRPVINLADRIYGSQRQINAAVDEAKLHVARSRL